MKRIIKSIPLEHMTLLMILMGHLWSEILSLLTPQLPENWRHCRQTEPGLCLPSLHKAESSILVPHSSTKARARPLHKDSPPNSQISLLIPTVTFAGSIEHEEGARSEGSWKWAIREGPTVNSGMWCFWHSICHRVCLLTCYICLWRVHTPPFSLTHPLSSQTI